MVTGVIVKSVNIMKDKIIKYPKIPEEFDDRKKLTVKRMVFILNNFLTYRQMAELFGVSHSLFGKMKLTPEEARQKRYQYDRGTGNTVEWRKKLKELCRKEFLEWQRMWRKSNNDKSRKNKFSPRIKKDYQSLDKPLTDKE